MSNVEYRRRRRRLLEALGADAIALIAAALPRERTPGVAYPYRQNSDVLYLTGFPEPDALLVFAPGRKEGEVVLFCQPRDEERERWEGSRVGVEGAVATYGADVAYPIGDLSTRLPELLIGRKRLYYPLGREAALDARVMDWVRRARSQARPDQAVPTELVAIDGILHGQRLIKAKPECRLLSRAARISATAHRQVMRLCRPGRWEYELEAAFIHACARRGARFQAYPPIVAGGVNACTLHYVENRHRLADGELVLVDAGCEVQGYASDITRTYPVNGRFSSPQRALYEVVLAAQEAAIAKALPGNRWNEPHDAAVQVLTQGLVALGILKGTKRSVPKHIREGAYRPYFMHKTGHWLGLDVHDVGDYKEEGGQWRLLQPGMVFTVEPGLYFSPNRREVPREYRTLGIRIEDTLLITEAGHEVLSAGAPKRVEEIEGWMGRSGGGER